ncbi:MAG: NTP transferase domain-containing protein [Syntrophales bacterium]|nr:NTP transferase domain-containing protein [Syntrophales bacterium]
MRTIILAAGKGKRMGSALPKVLNPLCGRPMLAYVVECARQIGSKQVVIVVGHQARLVMEAFSSYNVTFVLQVPQLGTGHAVLQTEDLFLHHEGSVLILCGDVPLIRVSTLEAFCEYHRSRESHITIMTTCPEDPGSYGRVVRDDNGSVLKIVEASDAQGEERDIREVNTGIFLVDTKFLFRAVRTIQPRNVQGEYYLTDIVYIARKEGLKVEAFLAEDPHEFIGINTQEDLVKAEMILKGRLNS